ncbi:MAG: nitroreductase family protein [Candidatus Riflebacteria bacterium]|nr:nitroreductase family protein [Candidatus Riflebacteria bacterium]
MSYRLQGNSRAFFSLFSAALFVALFLFAADGMAFSQTKDISLVKPSDNWGSDLGSALYARKSSRAFSEKKIGTDELTKIFWAAAGINRENGKRTSPVPRGFNFIKMYYLSREGNYRYEASASALVHVSDEMIIEKVSPQPWIASTSAIIVYVAELNEYKHDTPKDDKLKMAYVTSGCMAQNVYLAVASMKMGACIVFGFTPDVLKTALSLKEDEVPLFIQPFGFLEKF